jgi:hypothetical protein
MEHISEAKFTANTKGLVTKSDDKRGVLLVYLSTLAFNIAAIFTKSIDAPRSHTTKVPALNDHLRRDVGIDDGHSSVQTNRNDPLEIEIRKLRDRL